MVKPATAVTPLYTGMGLKHSFTSTWLLEHITTCVMAAQPGDVICVSEAISKVVFPVARYAYYSPHKEELAALCKQHGVTLVFGEVQAE